MKTRFLLCVVLWTAAVFARAEDWAELARKGEEAYREKNYEEAFKHFESAISQSPRYPLLYLARAECRTKLGKPDAALRDLDIALELAAKNQPGAAAAIHAARAEVYHLLKDDVKAVADLEKALELDPRMPMLRNNLAWSLATSFDSGVRDPKKAVALAWAEVRSEKWKEARTIDTLAAAYAAAGRFDEAVRVQEKAVSMISDDREKADAEKRLELYRNKQAYVEQVPQE